MSLTATGTPFIQNFDGIGSSGTAALPTGWRVSGGTTYSAGTTATTLAAGTTGTGALTGSSAGGVYNFANGITASSTDRAIGFLTSGGFTSPRSLMVQLTNNTGATITALTIGFNYEKYRSGSNANGCVWTFFHGSDGTTWTGASAGDQTYPADANNTTISNPPGQTAKSVSLTGLSIANGASYYLRWTYTVAGNTSAQGIGVDDVSITAPASGPTLNITGTPTNLGSSCLGTGATAVTYTIGTTGAAAGLAVSSNNTEFAVSSLSTTSLAGAGSTATFQVTFTPTTAGARTATITASSTTSGSTNGTIALSGTGVAAVTPSVSTSAASGITGAGAATLNGSVATLGVCPATTARGFAYSGTNNNPEVGGADVTAVSVGGAATGSFSAGLSGLVAGQTYYYKAYVFNGSTYAYGAMASFTIPTGANLGISGTVSHGSACVGVAASTITYTINNTGGLAGTLTSVTSDNAQFVVSGLSGTTVPVGGSQTFAVTFTPSAAGGQTATLTVNGENNPTFSISGTGTALVAPPAPTANMATAGTATGATLGGTTTAATCPSTLTGQGIVLSKLHALPTLADTVFAFADNAPGTKTVAATGLRPGTAYYYRTYATNSAGTTYAATAGRFNTRKLEPTNHVATFASSTQTTTSITFTWADNNGAAQADSFLVRIGTTAPADPVDGTVITANATNVYVARGVQTVTFTGLTASTSYTAAIYPLVNTGVGGIDYKTAGVPTVTVSTSAGPMAAWRFTVSASPWAATTVNGSALSAASNLTVSPASTITYQASPSNVNTGSWSTSPTFSAAGKFWEFTVTPVGTVTLSAVQFDAGRTTAGPQTIDVYYSLDGFATAGVAALTGASNANTSGLTTFNLTSLPGTTASPITFRIYGYGASSTGNFRLNNIEVYGTFGTAPLLAVSQTVAQPSGSSFSFGNVETGTFIERDFTLANPGSQVLNISSIQATGAGFSITSGGGTTTIPAGNNATVRVRYTASALTLQAGTLDIVSDASNVTGTYTVNLTGTGTPSAQSDVVLGASGAATVDFTLYQSASITNVTTGAGGSYGLMRIDIRDGGGTPDNDILPTIVSGLTFMVNNGAAIRQAALFSTANAKLNVADPAINAGAGTITFSGLPAGSFTVADNGTLSIWLRVSFTTTVTDNQALVATLTAAVTAAPPTSSTFKVYTAPASSGTASRTLVTGTQLGFVTSPGGGTVGFNSNFTLSVQVQDANGNRDLDVNTGTVTIVRTAGTGTLTGTATGSIAAGFFQTTNLRLDVIESGVQLQASISPALTPGPSVITTTAFVVSGVGYTIGCYRTTATGSASYSDAANWEVLQADGTTWLAASSAPDDITTEVHIERSMTMGSYSGPNNFWTVNKMFVKNAGTTLTTNPGTNPGLNVVGADGELRILAGARVQAEGGIFMRDVLTATTASTAKLTVDSLGTLAVNFNVSNQSLIWNGVENFKNSSTLEVQSWNTAAAGEADKLIDPAGTRTISPNAAGYLFGNININSTAGSRNPFAEHFKLVPAGATALLCQGNLTVTAANGFFVYGSVGNATITYGGLRVQTGNSFAFYAHTANTAQTSTIVGNLEINGTATVDMNRNTAGGGRQFINLQGNLVHSGSGAGQLRSTDYAFGSYIRFAGGKRHTFLQVGPTAPANRINWQVGPADTVQLLTNLPMGDSCNVTVLSGGRLELLSGLDVVELPTTAANTSFNLAAGGTLLISDNNGLVTTGATGAVQTDVRTFDAGANYVYRSALGADQQAGNALPATLSGILEVQCVDDSRGFFLAQSTTITGTGKFVLKAGSLGENLTGPILDGAGSLEMSGGVLTFNRVGATLVFPRLTGAYTLTGGTINLNGTTAGSNIQQLRGGRTYWNVGLGGISSVGAPKRITSAVVINNSLTITNGEVLDAENNGLSGPGGLTIQGLGHLRLSRIGSNLPELMATAPGATYNLSSTSLVELYGTTAVSGQQGLRGTFGSPSQTVTYGRVLFNATSANFGVGNVDLQASINVATELRVEAPAVLNLDASDFIAGAGSVVLAAGTGLRFANADGINSAGVLGHIRVAGTRQLAAQATYIAAGNQANATFGNGIPAGADTVVIARTGGDIAVAAGGLKVGKKLRFASASNITTGADTVAIDNGGFVVGEAADRYVQGLLKVYRTAVPVGSETDFGGMGLKVTPQGASPGYTVATRRTGSGAVSSGYLANQSIARYYDVTATNNTGLNARLELAYFDAELAGASESLLDAFRSTDAGSTWSRFGAIARNPVENFIRIQGVPGFSRWTMGDGSAPLPVTLASFEGKVAGAVAELTWQTAAEVNSAGFAVERSADGRSFAKVGFVASKAQARLGSTYAFIDRGFSGKAYYRLQQIDLDGTTTYSQTILLQADAVAGAPKLYPMPAAGTLTLSWPGKGNSTVQVEVLSITGQMLMEAAGDLQRLSAQLTDAFQKMQPGSYVIRLRTEEGQTAVLKVTK